jgi:hypothetical protein
MLPVSPIAQEISRRISTAAVAFDPKSGHIGFMVDKVELKQVFSEYFDFPSHYSFH